MELRSFPGLHTDFDPLDLSPAGASTVQTNIMSLSPSKLTVRKGLTRYDFKADAGHNGAAVVMFRHRRKSGESVILQDASGSISISGNAGLGRSLGAVSIGSSDPNAPGMVAPPGYFGRIPWISQSPNEPACFAQTPSGNVVQVSPLGRGAIYFLADTLCDEFGVQVYPLGISAPAASPTIVATAGGASGTGTYWCAYRFTDKMGIPSSLSPATEVTATANQKFGWSGLIKPSESRVTRIELYRTLLDDSTTFYLVAVLPASGGSPGEETPLAVAATALQGSTQVSVVYFDTTLPAGTKVLFHRLAGSHASYGDTEVTLSQPSGGTTLYVNPTPGPLWAGQQGTTVSGSGQGYQDDTFSDATLAERFKLPILYADGTLHARRFEPPPRDARIVCNFQDRFWYVWSERNLLSYSEPEEPESVPNAQDGLRLQDDELDSDDITAVFVHGSTLWAAQSRHLHRVTFTISPKDDGNASLVWSRGALNQRCVRFMGDTAYLLDQFGPWKFGPDGIDDKIDENIRDYFRDEKVDLAKSKAFFVSVDPNQRTVRFHVILAGSYDTRPRTALVYSPQSGAWWVEEYPWPLGAACGFEKDYRDRTLVGNDLGVMFVMNEGLIDDVYRPIEYTYRTGMLKLPDIEAAMNSEEKQVSTSIAVWFRPTEKSNSFDIQVYFDHALKPESWHNDLRETGLAARYGESKATVDMTKGRSILGEAMGFERLPLAARAWRRWPSTRCLRVELSGVQKDEAIEFFTLDVECA